MLDTDTHDLTAPGKGSAYTEAPECPTPTELLELFGSGALVLLVVSTAEVAPRIDGSLRRFVAECEDLVVGRIGAGTVDPESLWFRMFAAPKLRRVGLPTDRVLPGYYLFRYDMLLGWCPATQPAGRFFADLAGMD